MNFLLLMFLKLLLDKHLIYFQLGNFTIIGKTGAFIQQ